MREALVIGTGFLGSQVLAEMQRQGWRARGASFSGGDEEFACDLSSLDSLKSIAREVPQPDLVVHCASSPRGSGVEGYEAVYLGGCRNLAAAFPGSHLIYTASTSVYGQTDGSVVTEQSPTEPPAATSRVLLEAESVILENGGTVLRLAGLYGPGRSFILKKFLAGEAVIEEGGGRYLNQIHRDDAARALVHLASRAERASGKVFNVADSRPMTQRECFTALAEHFDRPVPPEGPRKTNKKRGWTNKQVSNKRLRESGWEPAYPNFLNAVDEIVVTI